METTNVINILGISLNFAAAICFAWPEERIAPNEVTWLDVMGSGKMEKIKMRKRRINIAGFILLGLGLLCQIRVAFELFLLQK